MIERLQDRFIQFLHWTEKYTKTDMVYLAQTGWWTNLNIVIVTVLGLGLSTAFANLLSPQTYGVYQYLIAIAGLFTAVSLSGMNGATGQAAARGYEGTLRAAIRVQLRWAVLPALATLTGAVYYFFHDSLDLGFGLIIIAFLTPIVNSFGIYSVFLTSKQEFKANFYFSTGISVAYYAAMFIAALFVKDAALFVLVNLGVNAFGTLYVYRKMVQIYKPNNRVDPEAIPYGRHLSVLSAWVSILTQLDSIFVFHFLGAAQLAVYSFTTLIPERAGSLFNFLSIASLPKFANQKLEYIKRNILSKVIRVALIGVITAGVYALGAPLLFHLLFSKYVSAIRYTQIYAPIIAVMAMLNFVQGTLIAKRFIREIYIVSTLQPILLVALQLPMLLVYGILGMVFARIISDVATIALVLILLFMRKKDTI